MPVTSPTPFELRCAYGEDIAFDFLLDPPGSIAGWQIALAIKRQRADPTILLDKTAIVSDANAGAWSFEMDHDEYATVSLNPGQYAADVWRTMADGKRLLGLGTLTVTPEVRY